MIKALKKKYALSDQGAKDLLKGFVYSVLANISLMFPVILLAIVLNQLLAPVLGASAPEISAAVYTVIGIVILAVVFIFHYCQYTATYLGTYDESARRRIGLAEKLRTLPLTFFHQRDLADLTSTIMGDCANFEHAFSHTVPQFFGAVISTGIVCIGLLIFNWQMGLALLWVAPISFAIVILEISASIFSFVAVFIWNFAYTVFLGSRFLISVLFGKPSIRILLLYRITKKQISSKSSSPLISLFRKLT